MDSTQSAVIQLTKEVANQWGPSAPDQILAWLEAHEGWFPKAAILTGSGADPTAWDATLEELTKDGFVEVQVDNTRYRAKP